MMIMMLFLQRIMLVSQTKGIIALERSFALCVQRNIRNCRLTINNMRLFHPPFDAFLVLLVDLDLILCRLRPCGFSIAKRARAAGAAPTFSVAGAHETIPLQVVVGKN